MSDICSPAVQERNILSRCTLSCIISLRVFSWDISPYTLHIYILNEDIFNIKLHIHEITQSMINQSSTSWALNRTLFNSIYKRQWEAWHARLLDPAMCQEQGPRCSTLYLCSFISNDCMIPENLNDLYAQMKQVH